METACPQCGHRFSVEGRPEFTCPACGFPLAWPLEEKTLSRSKGGRATRRARFALLVGLLIFLMVFALGPVMVAINPDYFGTGNLRSSGVEPVGREKLGELIIEGPAEFELMTRKALTLIRQADPGTFAQMTHQLRHITFAESDVVVRTEGFTALVEEVNAFVDPARGYIWIMPRAVGGRPNPEANDYLIFRYAALLVHEWAHRRDFLAGKGLDPVAREVSAERAAVEFLRKAGAPGILIDQKEVFLADPNAPQYRRWYEFGRRMILPRKD